MIELELKETPEQIKAEKKARKDSRVPKWIKQKKWFLLSMLAIGAGLGIGFGVSDAIIQTTDQSWNKNYFPEDFFDIETDISGKKTLVGFTDRLRQNAAAADKYNTIFIYPDINEISPNAFNLLTNTDSAIQHALSNIKSVVIPSYADTNLVMGDYAFANLPNLVEVQIAGTKTIGHFAFENCTNLNQLTLSEGIETIKAYAFRNTGINGILTFPKSVKNIGIYAFSNCNNLTTAILPNDINELNENDAMVEHKIPDGIFYNCSSLNSFLFNEPGTNYANLAFNCIGQNAFSFTNLYYLDLSPFKVANFVIEENAFSSTPMARIVFDSSNKFAELKDGCFSNLNSLVNVSFNGASITKIGKNAFKGDTSLVSINLSTISNLNTLDSGCFSSCTSLVSIGTLPDTLTTINDHAFDSCNIHYFGYDSGSSLSYLGDYAFNKNPITMNLVLNGNLEHIGSYAFNGCNLLSFDFSNDSCLNYVGDYAFANNKNMVIKTMTVGGSEALYFNKVNHIGDDAFLNVKADTTHDIFIDSSLHFLGKDAFKSESNSYIGKVVTTDSYLVKTSTTCGSVNDGSVWALDFKTCSGNSSITSGITGYSSYIFGDKIFSDGTTTTFTFCSSTKYISSSIFTSSSGVTMSGFTNFDLSNLDLSSIYIGDYAFTTSSISGFTVSSSTSDLSSGITSLAFSTKYANGIVANGTTCLSTLKAKGLPKEWTAN